MAASTAAGESSQVGSHPATMSYRERVQRTTAIPLMRECSWMSADDHLGIPGDGNNELARFYVAQKPGDCTIDGGDGGGVSAQEWAIEDGDSIVEQAGYAAPQSRLGSAHTDRSALIVKEDHAGETQDSSPRGFRLWRNPFKPRGAPEAELGEVEMVHGEDGSAEHHENVGVSEQAQQTESRSGRRKSKLAQVLRSGSSSVKAVKEGVMKYARKISKVWSHDSVLQSPDDAGNQPLMPEYLASCHTPYPYRCDSRQHSDSATSATNADDEVKSPRTVKRRVDPHELNVCGENADRKMVAAYDKDFADHFARAEANGVFKDEVRDERFAGFGAYCSIEEKQWEASAKHLEEIEGEKQQRAAEREHVQRRDKEGSVSIADGSTMTNPISRSVIRALSADSTSSFADVMVEASRRSGLAALVPGPG